MNRLFNSRITRDANCIMHPIGNDAIGSNRLASDEKLSKVVAFLTDHSKHLMLTAVTMVCYIRFLRTGLLYTQIQGPWI